MSKYKQIPHKTHSIMRDQMLQDVSPLKSQVLVMNLEHKILESFLTVE